MADTTEPEMVMRLADSVKHAADYVQQACRNIASGHPNDPRTAIKLRECLNQASGCATQLAHARHNPAFLSLRDSLTSVSTTLIVGGLGNGAKHGMVLAQIGRVLDALHGAVLKLTNAGVVGRQDVLSMLDARQAGIVVQ